MIMEHYNGAVIVVSQLHKHKVEIGLFSTTLTRHAGAGYYYKADIDYRGTTRRTSPYESPMEALRAAKRMVDDW